MSGVGSRLVGRRKGEWLGLLRREAEVGEKAAQRGEVDDDATVLVLERVLPGD